MSAATAPLPPRPERVLGLDFSGAAQAGRKIWLAWCRPEGGSLRIERVLRAMDLPGGAPGRDAALNALRDHLLATSREDGGFAGGFDFPFGLHRSLVPEPDLPAFIRAFPGRYATPEALRAASRGAGGERALKRDCDREAETPFAPHNLRLYRQTWHGIRDVLAPLLAESDARILPIQPPAAGVPWLLEVCPASFLKRHGRYAPYKGRTEAHRRARAALVGWLGGEGMVLARSLAPLLVDDPEGDALDSVLAAWVAHRALQRPEALLPPVSTAHRAEGYVYA